MQRIAYLTSRDMVPGCPGVRGDLHELELQLAAMVPACAARGLALELRTWDDPALLWAVENGVYQAVVVGTPWDYSERAAAFCAVLERCARSVPVCNPPQVVRWNASKSYLRELEQAGVAVVPTEWVARVDAESLARARRRFGEQKLVAKPVVGACAVRQICVAPGEALPPEAERPPGAAMVQPFLPAVQREGELSFVFFGGRFSHALRKRPGRGDYRVQSIYGGREEVYAPPAAERELAAGVLGAVPGVAPEELLLARVDMVRDEAGLLRLMELELIEPYLYPEQGPELGTRFAAALERRLA